MLNALGESLKKQGFAPSRSGDNPMILYLKFSLEGGKTTEANTVIGQEELGSHEPD